MGPPDADEQEHGVQREADPEAVDGRREKPREWEQIRDCGTYQREQNYAFRAVVSHDAVHVERHDVFGGDCGQLRFRLSRAGIRRKGSC